MWKAKKTHYLKDKKIARLKCLVNKANSLKDPLETLQEFHEYVGKDNCIINLTCIKATEMSSKHRLWIFDIMERNMKNMYEQSTWGWDFEEKKRELMEPAAWYLLASCDTNFVGFSHFRFDIDYKVQVLYCYELQLELSIRGKGLGRFMMLTLESIALQNKMKKVVLTVFKHNPTALQFFRALGYKLDDTSPLDSEKKDYIILSKQNLTFQSKR